MFERAVDRVYGHLSSAVQQHAAKRFTSLVPEIITDAVARWALNNWATFDEAEGNCTIQLYRWLVEARRRERRFHALEVSVENLHPTPQMMTGEVSVTTAARPDIRISVRDVGVFLEAKRLKTTGHWCKSYVDEGMARFVSSKYAASEEFGMMVGYVQQPTTAGLRDRINEHVVVHDLMGAGHELADDHANEHAEWLKSSHLRASGSAIGLSHFWVAIP